MHRYFLLLLAALVSAAFAPTAAAIDFFPRPGHYASTPGSAAHVSFDLMKNGSVINLRFHGLQVNFHGGYSSALTFRFHKSRVMGENHLTNEAFSGHGVWETPQTCRGDFRFYKDIAHETNSYHHWHTHWVHE